MTRRDKGTTTTKGIEWRFITSVCHPFAGVNAAWNVTTRRLKLQCAACRNPVVTLRVKGE